LWVDSESYDEVLGAGNANNGMVNHDCELHLLCLRDLDLDSFYGEMHTSSKGNDAENQHTTRSRSATTSSRMLQISGILQIREFRPIAVIYFNGIEKGRTAVGNKKMIRSYLASEPRWMWDEETFVLRIPGTDMHLCSM
jgi:muramoyltetrapeptide carboxypeptidase LdcA involved in peptidoglycan recycling